MSGFPVDLEWGLAHLSGPPACCCAVSVSAGVVRGLRLGEALAPLEALVAQLAMLAITVLFPLLASDLSLAELSPLGLGGVVSAAVPHGGWCDHHWRNRQIERSSGPRAVSRRSI